MTKLNFIREKTFKEEYRSQKYPNKTNTIQSLLKNRGKKMEQPLIECINWLMFKEGLDFSSKGGKFRSFWDI